MCEIHGSYLVWVESAEEQTFVENLLQGHHHGIYESCSRSAIDIKLREIQGQYRYVYSRLII